MRINWSDLGNHSWEAAKGALYLGGACLMTNELLQAGNVVNFSSQLIKNDTNRGILALMALAISHVAEGIFERMGWETDSLWRGLAAASVSILATFSLAYAGSKGNAPAAYLMTGFTVCVIGVGYLIGVTTLFKGLKGAADTVVA
jgi:hypothetical protein